MSEHLTSICTQDAPAWLDFDYTGLMHSLESSPVEQVVQCLRKLVRTDLYFLLRYVLNRKDVEHPWLLARIREVQEKPDGHIDLWARGHYKSTVITYAKTVQDILASHGTDPEPHWNGLEPTFCIFSHTRPNAKKFMRQVKQELERNPTLLELFPDILWKDVHKQAPRWSEDAGIVVRRTSNPKEATLEAWGLIDGMPTGAHFNVLIYDDVVTRETVNTSEMIEKANESFKLSMNLGDRRPRKRIIGTRYHFADSYGDMVKRGVATARLHPATVDGTLTGTPVFLSQEELDDKIREMGPYVASAQLMQNPIADSKQSFKRDWLRHFKRSKVGWAKPMWRMLICDPANEKKKGSDWTAMGVIGAGPDRNLYALDWIRDRLNLQERAKAYMRLHRKWSPQFSGYEKYGKDSDIQYIQEVQDNENYRFEVVELGGKLSKPDRINRLIPYFAEGRFYLPDQLYYTPYDKKPVDLVETFINEEYAAWPVPLHDDVLDFMSRALDENVIVWPRGAEQEETRERYVAKPRHSAWSA